MAYNYTLQLAIPLAVWWNDLVIDNIVQVGICNSDVTTDNPHYVTEFKNNKNLTEFSTE